MVRVLLTGVTGQLGRALVASAPQQLAGDPLQLVASARNAAEGVCALDLADSDACREWVLEHRPDWVINAGAYTAVDQAESEPDLAMAINAEAPRAFAEALAVTGGRLLQVSTDFVFDGSQGHPYATDQLLRPLGSYGLSKAEGEQAVAGVLGLGPGGRGLILRTSWLYGPVGRNFLLTMLRLHQLKAAQEEPLRVVADQVGAPTSTVGLARACWSALDRTCTGILHWSDAGAASWYDFAMAIGELAVDIGLLAKGAQVEPISTSDYPTPAKRPAYSLLECVGSREQLGLTALHWRDALREVIQGVEP